MKKHLLILAVLTIIISTNQALFSQTKEVNTNDLRTQSGVDPTRVVSKIGYSIMYYDKLARNTQINNRVVLNLGVNRWSFTLKSDIVSILDGSTGEGFKTGFGDAKLTFLNSFYNKGKVALAASVEFGLPLGNGIFGSGSFSATPAMTMSYTINEGLFLAVQLQYSFAIARSSVYPQISVLTARIFTAKFIKAGYFFVLEPRPIYNFQNGEFDLIISPLIGKSLGKGFNLIGLAEVPTKQSTIDQRGILIQVGINKSF